MRNPRIEYALWEITRAIEAAREAFSVTSSETGHRAAMAKGQLAAAIRTLGHAKQFLSANERGLIRAVDENTIPHGPKKD